jgi:hypothetical protein
MSAASPSPVSIVGKRKSSSRLISAWIRASMCSSCAASARRPRRGRACPRGRGASRAGRVHRSNSCRAHRRYQPDELSGRHMRAATPLAPPTAFGARLRPSLRPARLPRYRQPGPPPRQSSAARSNSIRSRRGTLGAPPTGALVVVGQERVMAGEKVGAGDGSGQGGPASTTPTTSTLAKRTQRAPGTVRKAD